MRSAYLLSSYLHINALTSPSREWINTQMSAHGIDPNEYSELTTLRVAIMAIFLVSIIIGEAKSHRFFIAQTEEESKYPWKPQRCSLTLWISLVLVYIYPDSRVVHYLLIVCLQRVVINHLYIIQVRMMSAKSLMYFISIYVFGYVFRIITFYYTIY